MARKKNTTPATELVLGDDPTTETVELVKEIPAPEFSALVNIISQKPAPEPTIEEVLKVEEDIRYYTNLEVEGEFQVFKGIGLSMYDYAVEVGGGEAVRLLQKILGIAKTNFADTQTISAWVVAVGKRELIDDYNNMRKDSHKDLTAVRQRSKEELSL